MKEKLKIKDFAKLLGYHPQYLRELEKEGKIPPARRDQKGWRYYTYEDLIEAKKKLNQPITKRAIVQIFINYKGGTGKSTIASNYAHRLALLGMNVLAIDLDPQAHLTRCLGIPDDHARTLKTFYDCVVYKNFENIIKVKNEEKLHLIPSNVNLITLEKYLQQQSIAPEMKIFKTLQQLMNEFHYIIIDCAPGVSLINTNAIVSADDIFIPILPDFLSYDGLHLLFNDLKVIQENASTYHVRRIKIIVNRFDQRMVMTDVVLNTLKKEYEKMMLQTIIRQDATIERAQAAMKTIFEFSRRSKFAEDIAKLTNEILSEERYFTPEQLKKEEIK